MATELPFEAHELWFATFRDARTTSKRLKIASELPNPLSRGWIPTVRRAREIALKAGQNAVGERLRRRIDGADPKTVDAVDGLSFTCSYCGEKRPASAFKARRMSRRPKADPVTGAPVLLPHWTLVSVSDEPDETGRYSAVIQVRQARCGRCR